MPLRVGTTSGIYYAARAAELSNAIRKLGYTLTRGVGCMEIPADVAHEVPFTHGQEIRQMARKQGVTVNFHGDLTVPIEMPERGDWRDAHDRMTKSIRSAVFVGSQYIDFHACLNIWLELITYGGRKLTLSFCDSEGRFITHILKESPKTREWFVKERGEDYMRDILSDQDFTKVSARIETRIEKWYRMEVDTRVRKELERIKPNLLKLTRNGDEREVERVIDNIIEHILVRGLLSKTEEQALPGLNDVVEELRKERVEMNARIRKEEIHNAIALHLKEGRRWESEELRAVTGIVDGYHIMAQHLYSVRDPLWVAMEEQYKDVLDTYKRKVKEKFGYSYGDLMWLDGAWKVAEDENDRTYKEFFYAAVSSKYLEGHLKAAFKWIDEELIKKEIPSISEASAEEKKELINIAKNIIIGIENPDAREPSHAGLYFIWKPKQLYAAIKTIRKTLKTDRVMLIPDFEHLATQGADALLEYGDTIKDMPDFGELCVSVHSNHPNPLHPHDPIELGDIVLYKLFWMLRQTGLGKNRTAFLIFERGGGEDPFKHSVDSLRLMVQFLEKDIPPDDLPMEFFGVKGPTAGDVQRQMQIVKDHAWEPLKDLLEIPEEEWTFLSQSALRKGKKPEVWKRGEFR